MVPSGPMSSFDAIVIPGGGLLADGTLPPWVLARVERALSAAAGTDAYIITLSAATFHKPTVLDAGGKPQFESVIAARYLMERGFSGDRLLLETSSYDTIGNAYFCRAIHTDPRRLARLLIVTSAFHMLRTEAIFRWVFSLEPVGVPYQLAFESTADMGVDSEALAARCEKERAGLAELLPKTRRYRTLADFHRWVFSEHRIYAPRLWDTAQPPLPAEALKTY
jgi:uncharacterized SAM-binding protein YcdF (DUF218 family)